MMEEYLKLLKRRLARSEDQVLKRVASGSETLTAEGFRMLGYYQGRVSILEDAVDEIESHLRSTTQE